MKSLETLWQQTIAGRGGRWGVALRPILGLMSHVYGCITACRNYAYDCGWFKRHRPENGVIISVGNLVVGGTGKTPVTVKIGQALQQKGSLAILTRGYRSAAEKAKKPLHIAPGQQACSSACGDEPALLAQRLSHAHVVVGRDRVAGAAMATTAGAKFLLLDDGLQHRRLERDCDVVVVDADNPFGYQRLFPRGLLRESARGLKRAHLIVINHVRSTHQFQQVQQQLRNFTHAPCVGMQPVASGRQIDGTAVSLQDVQVGLFCGIGQPQRFVDTVVGLGAKPVATLFSDDHALPNTDQLQVFAVHCQTLGAHWLLCTEKDSVKLPKDLNLPLPIAVVTLDLEIVAGEEQWHSFLATFS